MQKILLFFIKVKLIKTNIKSFQTKTSKDKFFIIRSTRSIYSLLDYEKQRNDNNMDKLQLTI